MNNLNLTTIPTIVIVAIILFVSGILLIFFSLF